METKYIYGIIETAKDEFLSPCGVAIYEEVYPDTKSFGVGVYTIPYRDISAVVSDSPFVDYTTLPKDKIARYLLRHQQVIEKIMDAYTIIPMRLGTYAFNASEVIEILSKGYIRFKDVFGKIDNKIEIDVVATWNDLNSAIKEIGELQEIKGFKEKLMSKSAGVSVEDQMMIGSLIKNILDKEREKLASEIKDVLGKVSIDSRAHDLMDARMILNTAYLLDKNKKYGFEGVLNELNKRYDGKINFRCVEPLPPYSFYTAEVKKMRFEELDWARKRLCLSPDKVGTKNDIEKAYKNRALVYHPDRNPDTLDSDKEFNEINKAYKLLLDYCLSAEQAGQAEEYSFKEDDLAKNVIIVKVRD
jgi:hypothetical protein